MHPWHAKVVNSCTPIQKDTTSLQKISPLKMNSQDFFVFLKAIKIIEYRQSILCALPSFTAKKGKKKQESVWSQNKQVQVKLV